MQHRVSTKLFLIGCAALPFFNDFPYLSFITPSFLDFSLFFYAAALIILIFESSFGIHSLKLSRGAIFFISILFFSIFISFAINTNSSSNICGIEECAIGRMVKTTASDLLKFSLIVFFVYYIKSVGIYRLAVYVRLGFYISFSYVLLEIFLSVVPYLFGAERFQLMSDIDSIFHVRVNDWGGLRTRGLSFEPGYQGVFLIICLPFIFSDENSSRFRRNIFLWVVSIITTFAPGAIIAGMVFLLTYKFKSNNIFLVKICLSILSIPFLIVIYLTMVSGADLISSTTRIGSWIASMYGIFNNIFFGVGPGMSGYWIVLFYPDLFYVSPEAGQWVSSGVDFLNAPTFSSLLNFILNYGLFPIFAIFIFSYKTGIFKNIFLSNIGRSAFYSLLIVSFTITSYQVMGYLLFVAISLVDGWRRLDEIRSCQ